MGFFVARKRKVSLIIEVPILKYFLYLLIFSNLCHADSNQARQFYDQKNYSESLSELQKSGLNSSSDFYNAGLSAYRLGKIGLSFAYFLKAHELNPNNEDIEYNLNISRDDLEKTSSVMKSNSFLTNKIYPILKKQNHLFSSILLLVISLIIVFSSYYSKKRGVKFKSYISSPLSITLLVVWLISTVFLYSVFNAQSLKRAVVVADQTSARSGPSDSFTELFHAPSGTVFELSNQTREGWIKIRFSLGNVGWVMEKDLLRL